MVKRSKRPAEIRDGNRFSRTTAQPVAPVHADWRPGDLLRTRVYLRPCHDRQILDRASVHADWAEGDADAKRKGLMLKHTPAIYLGELGRVGKGTRVAIHYFLFPWGPFVCEPGNLEREESAPESDEEV